MLLYELAYSAMASKEMHDKRVFAESCSWWEGPDLAPLWTERGFRFTQERKRNLRLFASA